MRIGVLWLAFMPLYLFAQSASDAIDLGLSVKWASHNIGAKRCEQAGDLYSWGETVVKNEYTADNYRYKDGDSGWTLDIGKEISATGYDVARVLWKGEWRLPTHQEMLELCEKCIWEWTSKNNIYGYEITGPNGNKIFMPAGDDNEGHYWSGTLSQGLGRTAIELFFAEDRFFTFGTYKTNGLMVRPVITDGDYVEKIDVPKEWQDEKYADLLSHIEHEDYEQAFIESTVLAGMGDAQAQIVLASMYFYGAGTSRNYEASQEQLVAAAEQGSERAEYMMGGFGSLEKHQEFMKMLTGEYDTGNDIEFWKQMMSTETLPTNYKEAFRWFFLEEGEWGYRDIMYYCGIALITGQYGYQNQEHGLLWIVRSARMGYPEAVELIEQLSSGQNDD